MRNTFVFLGILAIVSVACDSGSETSPSGDAKNTDSEIADRGECDDGQTRCRGDMLQRCEKGTWRDWTDCAGQGQFCFLKEGVAECRSKEDTDPGDPVDTGDRKDTGRDEETTPGRVDTGDGETGAGHGTGFEDTGESSGTEDTDAPGTVTDSSGTESEHPGTASDTGTGSEQETDSSSQSGDTDTDTESASETEEEPLPCECKKNSGYPCHCDRLGDACDDGSECLLLSATADEGICLKTCAGQGDDATCAVNMDCFAQGRCGLPRGDSYCGYICDGNDDCPTPMVCDKSLGVGICAPEQVPLEPEGPCDECPLGEWPCPCDTRLETPCTEGSICAIGEEDARYGICLKPCTKNSECFVDMKCGITQNGEEIFSGYQMCGLQFRDDPDKDYCGWFCEEDYDCPPNEKCVEVQLDLKLCFGDADLIEGDSDSGQ